jgi:hypothetical protein
MAGAAWNASGKRQGNVEVEPPAEKKYTPRPIYAEREYPRANMIPCIETMNPLDSGVETSAWYMGMQVTGCLCTVNS